jgi:hypothetical protein
MHAQGENFDHQYPKNLQDNSDTHRCVSASDALLGSLSSDSTE